MSEFISKIAKVAASKAAGFGYAVAVGVAGNLAFHYVQPPEKPVATPAAITAPAPTAVPSEERNPAAPAPSIGNVPHAPPSHGGAGTASARVPPVAPPRQSAAPPSPAPVAVAPILPEPPNLPQSEALPAPVFKPLALPKAPPSEAALHPAPAPEPAPVEEPPPGKPAATAALPPLDPPIEVAAPPMPPSSPGDTIPAAVRVAPPTAIPPVPGKEPSHSGLAISDLWHPGRAIDKSLHWAGRQVPLIGDADAKPHPAPVKVPAHSAPISLLPQDSDSDKPSPGEAAPAKPPAPGPGRGGLY